MVWRRLQVLYSQLFPAITPPGFYDVTLNGHSITEALFCVKVEFQVCEAGGTQRPAVLWLVLSPGSLLASCQLPCPGLALSDLLGARAWAGAAGRATWCRTGGRGLGGGAEGPSTAAGAEHAPQELGMRGVARLPPTAATQPMHRPYIPDVL